SLEPTPDRLFDAFPLEQSDVTIEAKADASGAANAADFDATLDRKDEANRHGTSSQPQLQLTEQHADQQDEDDDDDMFAVDEEDMFKSMVNEVRDTRAVPVVQKSGPGEANLPSNWDDDEGYYRVIIGEMIDDGRYHIQSNLGKGMFSTVVKAVDNVDGREVAIKIVRSNEVMYKAGIKEVAIVRKLNEADPGDRKHLIRLLRSFEFRGHLCIVFEGMTQNLREVLKKYGRDAGLNIKAVQAYAQQSFLALLHLRRCNVLHADLKPDNILVNESRTVLKVCDLGSASDASENTVTPYLASRFYRAPELIVGLPYDFAIDMWSIGCTLFELYTGKILFAGANNNQMLKVIMQARGKIPHKLLRRGAFTSMHFDSNLTFLSREQDSLTGKQVSKPLSLANNTTGGQRDIKARVLQHHATRADERLVAMFADLLDKCLNLNPEKRLTPAEALRHPFVQKQ
ncbi:kinase-like domain-containing protein, partial [Lipomyces arxii]|uniref:kinase-like domain-containing protein n=1 Tax=Lipomyces arxii TaxID=56418 RepID=UPI0034CEF0BA